MTKSFTLAIKSEKQKRKKHTKPNIIYYIKLHKI